MYMYILCRHYSIYIVYIYRLYILFLDSTYPTNKIVDFFAYTFL